MFDLPGPLVAIVAGLAAVHLLRTFLSPGEDEMVLALFAFIPDRYVLEAGEPAYPGGWGGLIWSFVTHAGLHGGWMHLVINSVMLAAIGRVATRRLGTVRLAALMVASAAGGAAAHLVFDWGSGAPMIGASGVVFGLMGATLRFAFTPWWGPPTTVVGALRVARVRAFIAALVLMNVILVVFGSAPFGGDAGGGVAWAAHLGGFLVGFLGFRLFDRPWRPAAID